MIYSVLVKAIVNVRLDNIEADSQADAVNKVQNLVDLNKYFNHLHSSQVSAFKGSICFEGAAKAPFAVRYIEYADEDQCYLVDEDGDTEFERSQWYEADGSISPDQAGAK